MHFHNSPGTLADFFERSTIWQDIRTILVDWIEGLHELLEEAPTIEFVKQLQGNIEALRRVDIELADKLIMASENIADGSVKNLNEDSEGA